MFKKKDASCDNTDIDCSGMNNEENLHKHQPNSILKGSKLTGDILISYDLELDGDVEGNITSEQKSNVVIKGKCRGSIKVKEGNVSIEGQMSHGDIIAGGDVSITGTFNGGKIEAQGKIFVDGTCSGTLTAKDIEIGRNARGTGDILYRDSISIARGAIVEIQIKKSGDELKKPRKTAEAKVTSVETSPSVSEIIMTQFPVTSTSRD